MRKKEAVARLNRVCSARTHLDLALEAKMVSIHVVWRGIEARPGEIFGLYTYARFPLAQFPCTVDKRKVQVDDEVDLKHCRLQKISQGAIDLLIQPDEASTPVRAERAPNTVRLTPFALSVSKGLYLGKRGFNKLGPNGSGGFIRLDQ
ncbi:MAG: hypothetical protein HEQ39_14730 [Rhizobacter sp.]